MFRTLYDCVACLVLIQPHGCQNLINDLIETPLYCVFALPVMYTAILIVYFIISLRANSKIVVKVISERVHYRQSKGTVEWC